MGQYNTKNAESMLRAGFEPEMRVFERSQSSALDRETARIGVFTFISYFDLLLLLVTKLGQ